jgi:hypothetical protein
MKRVAKAKPVRYPCSVCDRTCGFDTIECSDCGSWVHKTCASMNNDIFAHFSAEHAVFMCPRCLGLQSDGSYDCNIALDR